jgi:urea-proton symporter
LSQALSAELIATSTLLSYDVYRHYFRPNATSQDVVRVARYFILFWAIFSGALASVFNAVGIVRSILSLYPLLLSNFIQSLGWLFYFLGVATASGVFPIALTFTWRNLSTAGAVSGSVGGMIIALIVWLATAKATGGAITVETLSAQWVHISYFSPFFQGLSTDSHL